MDCTNTAHWESENSLVVCKDLARRLHIRKSHLSVVSIDSQHVGLKSVQCILLSFSVCDCVEHQMAL